MPNEPDVLSAAVVRAIARDLSVPDLIRTTETLKQSGQANAVATLYAAWVQNNADNPLLYAVLFNQAVTLTDAGDLLQARACLERAIALNPDFMPAYINLGRVYERLGSVGLALVQWSAALSRMAAVNGAAVSHKTTALNQSARALETANQDEAAETMLRQSLELDCHQREVVQHLVALRQRQCEWPVVLPSERVDRNCLLSGMSPLSAGAYHRRPALAAGHGRPLQPGRVGAPPGVMDDGPLPRPARVRSASGTCPPTCANTPSAT